MAEAVLSARRTAVRVAQARALGLTARRRRVPKPRPPTLIESDYAGRLVELVGRMREAAHHIERGLSWLARRDARPARYDVHPGAEARRSLERVRAEVEGAFDPHAFDRLAEQFGKRVSDHQRSELLRQGQAALGVDVVLLDPTVGEQIAGFVHENAALIRKLQGNALDEVGAIVTRAMASGTRAEVIAQEISARFDIAERHARLIARDQIGKLNSRIAEARHGELGIRAYIWTSMRDPLVRPRHRYLHGHRIRYDQPPPEGHAGMPIACRCLQQPAFDDIYAELDALGV